MIFLIAHRHKKTKMNLQNKVMTTLVSQIKNLPPVLFEDVVGKSIDNIKEELKSNLTQELKDKWTKEIYDDVKHNVNFFLTSIDGGYIPQQMDYKTETYMELAQQLYKMKDTMLYYNTQTGVDDDSTEDYIDYIDYGSDNDY